MPRTTTRRRSARALLAGAGVALLLAGCGFEAQTLQPYTPAHGVNLDAGPVKVRNLLVVADAEGEGIVSGSLLSSADDRLVGVTATPQLADGSDGAPLEVTTAGPIRLPANSLVVLTDPAPAVTLSGDELVLGGTVRLALEFASGVRTDALAPVMSRENSAYDSVTASPTPSATPSPTPTPSPSSTASATPLPTEPTGAPTASATPTP